MGVREGTDAMKKTLGALVLAAVAAAAVTTLVACGGGGSSVALVAYSTPREAYAELIPAFQKTAAGANVAFSESYGSSGEQSRAVEAGLPADVVGFSLAPDLGRPDEAGRRGDRTEPVHVRRRQVEHHGRLRRPIAAGEDGAGGRGVPGRALQARPGACLLYTSPSPRD